MRSCKIINKSEDYKLLGIFTVRMKSYQIHLLRASQNTFVFGSSDVSLRAKLDGNSEKINIFTFNI